MMTYQKAITDAETRQTIMVDLTPEEVAEIERKQAQIRANQEAEAAAQEAVISVVTAFPDANEINAARSMAEIKALMLRHNALLALLIKRAGLDQ